MKFSEFSPEQWYDLLPYMDTCLIPVSGLTGEEPPHEATERIAGTGDWLQPLEAAFRGRSVTMPANHYVDVTNEDDIRRVSGLCERMRGLGFAFVVVVSGRADWAAVPEDADLLIKPEEAGAEPDPDKLRQAIMALWKREAGAK
ncbi:DUF2487 family protein [Cohnella fermenti]|uniref:DUF2487 family protein n=1 Tax=Cohnella fermenti TaxID=2565925 RepID=A0A4S4BVD2_9BACL|nr:DUF2487 family protein [Cohnella fermenti]THF78390.1 DUF2487 family protein [Cohnella fermenti]